MTVPEVANPKLVDLTPTWRRYVGWTVLFCPPATTSRTYTVNDETPQNQAAYGTIADWFSTLEIPGTASLPPDTYHVTVCDGLSPLHDARLDDRWRRRVRRRLRRLPRSLARLDRPTFGHAIEVDSLVEACRRDTRFVVTGVEIRGTAVVARLAPDADDGWFGSVNAARAALLEALGTTIGAQLSTEWRPHVTLAYAADRAIARSLAESVESRSGELVAATRGRALGFTAADVFAFSDMITFHRRPV